MDRRLRFARDAWRSVAAMCLVLGAMLATALTMSAWRGEADGPALADGTAGAKEPPTTIRVLVERE
jgi:hypothetical protein